MKPNTFTDIVVPTMNNVRSAALIEYLLINKTNILCVGATGSGKTLMSAKLSRNMPKKYICDFVMTFSARTTAHQTHVAEVSTAVDSEKINFLY